MYTVPALQKIKYPLTDMLTLDRRVEVGDTNGRSSGISEFGKREMYETFQTWALKTYGDSGKTKTVTSRKYSRIVRILSGDEEATTENSKFRFWVKAKGFKLGKLTSPHTGLEHSVLYVPVKVLNESAGTENIKEYKRVAIVEDFFDIIYGVHVEMDGRGGKHAGQKRTYRAIAETYSFLPREAVTRFLMACTDCQKRMHISSDSHNKSSTTDNNNDETLSPKLINGILGTHPHIVDFRVPITQTYINQLRTSGCLPWPGYNEFFDDSASSGPSEMSTETSPSPIDDASSPKPDLKIDSSFTSDSISTAPAPLASTPKPQGLEEYFPLNMSSTLPNSMSPAPRDESKGHPERKRRASDDSLETSSKASETNEDSKDKDEDDDDDNDDDEKLLANTNIDPERLKSFNMFCRLFVDENLDRMVPISKQPKDKVQAILDACDRQFPEFHERSRKRIRTYLKSCRRMRRSKENGWEPLRPTPPHLTSAAAESYLAQACENESINAKRMKMGLEPLPANTMPITHLPPSVVSAHTSPVTQKPIPSQIPSPRPEPKGGDSRDSTQVTPTPTPTHVDRHTPVTVSSAADFIRSHPTPLTAFRPPPDFSPFFTNGNNGLFRPGFPGYQHPAHHHPPGLHSPIQPAIIQNGPTDLSMKKHSSKNQLSTSEMATIKQLISGYRESAAFLYRSADELEQLLLQQN